MNIKQFVAIIEARSNSSRLPGKHLLKVLDKTIIEFMLDRVKNSKYLDDIIVATTTNKIDDELVDILKRNNIKFFRGSENDVLKRVLDAAEYYNVENIVEIPGDCPLIDPFYIDLYIDQFKKINVDYLSSHLSKTFPSGFEVQIFPKKILKDVSLRTNCPNDREHVTLYIYNNPQIYKIYSAKYPFKKKNSNIKLTLDTEKDYRVIVNIIENIYPKNKFFGLNEILKFLS